MECPECSMTPMGEGCYRICPNSVHFYSPEQEYRDEMESERQGLYDADMAAGYYDPAWDG